MSDWEDILEHIRETNIEIISEIKPEEPVWIQEALF